MVNCWTEKHCKMQSEAIRRWKPWEKSTGPRTAKGKAIVAQNAFKGGLRPQLRELAKILRKQRHSLDELSTEEYDSMAETVVAAALDGHLWAFREIARVLDE